MTRVETIKKERAPLDILPDLERYAREGFAAIPPDDLEQRIRWYGLYTQQPPEAGFFMLRVRIPGGMLTAAQARTLGRLAATYGRDLLDLTVRQNVQYHWIRIEDVPAIFRSLTDVGLTTQEACGDVPRNVVSCPLAGVDPDEIYDARPLVRAVTDVYLTQRDLADLPRKFKTSISGCPRHCAHPEINDIGLTAVHTAQGVRFDVRVGGGLSTTPRFSVPLGVFVPPEEVPDLCRTIAEIFRDHGNRDSRNRARMKFLVEGWGADRFRDELEARLGHPFERHDPLPPLEPGAHRDHLGAQRQKQPGLFAVGVAVPVGRLKGSTLRSLADAAEEFGDGSLCTTNMQNLVLLNIPGERLAAFHRAVDDLGLASDEASVYAKGIVACTGNEFCKLALTETKRLGARLLRFLEERVPLDEQITLSVTGCPNSCGQYHLMQIGLMGCLAKRNGVKIEAYDVHLGGGVDGEPSFGRKVVGRVAADQIHQVLERLLRYYASARRPGEDLRAFCNRQSVQALAAAMRLPDDLEPDVAADVPRHERSAPHV